jgi:hypothetical protein
MPLNLGTFLIVWSRSDKCRKQLLEISEKRGRVYTIFGWQCFGSRIESFLEHDTRRNQIAANK